MCSNISNFDNQFRNTNQLDIVLCLGSVITCEQSDTRNNDFSNIVLVDASGPYLKNEVPERAGGSAGGLYNYLGLNQVKRKATSKIFESLVMGEIVYTQYTKQVSKTETIIDVIHAYSYNFSRLKPKTEEECIDQLSEVYKKVFIKFIEINKPVLRLVPLSGNIFSGEYRGRMNRITFQAIQKAYYSIEQEEEYKNKLNEKSIILCLFTEDEFNYYSITRLYKLQTTQQPITNSKARPNSKERPNSNAIPWPSTSYLKARRQKNPLRNEGTELRVLQYANNTQ